MSNQGAGLRRLVKRCVQGVVLLVGLPFWLVYRLKALIGGQRSEFACWSQCLSLIPGRCGSFIRWGFYFLAARRCSWDVTIEFGTIFSSPEIELGRHVYIGAYCVLGDVRIGDGVRIASGVSIPSGGRQHLDQVTTGDSDPGTPQSPNQYQRITIGEKTWIGERAVVLADVGARAIVGAGAVVTSPVPENCVVAGVPARVIRQLPVT